MGLFNLFKKKAETITEPLAETTKASLESRYSYEWNDDVPESERIPCNEFCEKLISLNRFYKRSEIQKISESVGYDVFNRKCAGKSEKHQWKFNLVTRKDI